MDRADTLAQTFLHNDSLEHCDLAALRELAGRYPYSTPLQFLLAKKLKSTDQGLYEKQVQQLSLHFDNPFWLRYILEDYKMPDAITSYEPLMDASHSVDEAAAMSLPSMPRHDALRVAETTEQVPSEIHPVIAASEVESQPAQSMETIDQPEVLRDSPQPGAVQLPSVASEVIEPVLSFEPFHTVDYFASQGIKFVAEERPADRFGQQLRSFTDWLKTMKKLPQAETAPTADPSAERQVQQLADRSVSAGDVVTEAMAEVWVKQGNREKAIEIYHKLGLLDPEKSTYFASLAEQVKNS
jgi:hypothetical protein